ncbi:MAG: PAS domain S-box protein [Euryarchaeota archaeon]|nr:PAS domain S-box protein [Euryarchaeota archaeon]
MLSDKILDSTCKGVWAVDKDKKILFFNKGMEDLTGLKKDEVLGKDLEEYVYSSEYIGDEAHFRELFLRVKETLEPAPYNSFPLVTKNGNLIFQTGELIPLLDEYGKYDGIVCTIKSVTEQEIGEETLRDRLRSKKRLKEIYKNSPVIAFLWTAEKDWPVEFVSENIAQFGYTPEDFVDGNMIYGDIVHPDDLDLVRSDISELEIGGQTYFTKEYRILTRSGEVRWVTERSMLGRSEEGEPTYYQGIIIDITDRKQAEEAMLESEKKYRLIFENSPLGIFHFDEKGVITHCNENIVKIIGTPRERIIGFNMLTDLKNEKMKAAVRKVFDRKNGHYEGEYTAGTSRKVTPIKADYSPNISEDGTLLGGVGIVGDISVRMKAEEGLRLDESRLETLVKLNQMTEASLQEIIDFARGEGVRLTSSDFGYIAFLDENEKLLKMRSWSDSAMNVCNIHDRIVEIPIGTTGLWGEAVRQRKAYINNDYDAPNPLKKGYPEGHVKLIRHMDVPVFEKGKIVALVGVGNKKVDYDDSDVRQLRLLIQGMWRLVQRRKAEDNLKEYSEQLAAANEELKSLDKMKDEFLSNVSHELKTPLTSINGYTQLVCDGTLGDLNEQQKKAETTVMRNTDRLKRLVDSLLYLSRTRAGTVEYIFEPLQISQIIDNTFLDLKVQAEGKGVTLETNVSDDLPTISGDRDKLMDMLTNLVDNSIKFTPKGGTVTASVEEEGKYLHLVVKDTGIGIPKDKIPKLFQRFYQIDASGKRKYGGTGLGLYICKKIVEAHNGNIWIESEGEGRGTEVHTQLPRSTTTD